MMYIPNYLEVIDWDWEPVKFGAYRPDRIPQVWFMLWCCVGRPNEVIP